MEKRFLQAAKGLRVLFIAYMISLAAQLLKDQNFYGIPIGTALELASLALICWAMWTAKSAHKSYRTAFWANLAALVMAVGSLVGIVLLENGIAFQLAGLLLRGGLLLMAVTRLAAELFIIHGTGKLLGEKGDRYWAWYAGFLWKALLIKEAAAVAVVLLASIMAMPQSVQLFRGIYAVVNMLTTAVGFGLSAFELVVLYHSFQTLPEPSTRATVRDS